MQLKNKTVLVTGAASGIGAATAKKLKSLGAYVVGFDLNEATEYVDEYFYVDLTDETAIDKAVNNFKGPAHALCNIAGVPPTVPPMVQMKVNFYGLRRFTELMIPKLAEGASIVNLASVAGMKYMEHIPQIKTILKSESAEEIEGYLKEENLLGDVTYGLSKEAVILWTLKMASILQDQKITIKSVSPGPVKTPILQDFLDTIAKKQALPPKGFEGDPNDIASVVSFLCSEEARWVNGRNIIVDGGLSAQRMSQGLGL